MVINLANQKGGVGKSTLSLNIAHALVNAGHRVLVIDADPQGSARDWLAARDKPAPFMVVGLDRPTIHRDLEGLAADYTDVVIDGPPRVTDIARSAILAADLVVIPVQPSPYDVWAAQETVGLIAEAQVYKESIKPVFAINREIVNTAIGRDVAAALEETDMPVLRSHVCQRVVFAESAAVGKTVFELDPEGKAAAEIAALTEEIRNL